MAIENRNLKPGTRLAAIYRKQRHTCEVREREAGKRCYRLDDGREFNSLSAAGMAITGTSCNGWSFWSVERNKVTPDIEARPADAPMETVAVRVEGALSSTQPLQALTLKAAATHRRRIFQVANQKGVPAGQSRWYCHDCGRSYLVPSQNIPDTCPQGHRA